ncbi:MAG: arylamine N-acetyltransferase [Candidatus Eisenbacteria bacterium]|nr:arylamine N-acetyltransferase [Candidatus Eisenbacteria bacterium]
MKPQLSPELRLLAHLELEPEAPTLEFLHRIIREHQLRVPFETLTKLIDYEPGRARGDFMPSMEEYVDRVVTRGAGGLCWTLARGLRELLHALGFDAALMYMDPGHCCVRVEFPEGPQYADVGYAAPIFRAYPLFESFTLETHRESFDYRVDGDAIQVTRNPGPTKHLDPTPRRLAELQPLITAANDWTVLSSFLRRLVYARYLDRVYTTLRDGVLTRYTGPDPQTVELSADQIPAALADVFHADPDLYREAAAVKRRHEPDPRPEC